VTRAVAKEGRLQVATKLGAAERPATRATKPWPRHGGRGTRAKQQRPAPGTDAGSAGSEDNSGGRSAGHGSRSKGRSGGPERKRRPTVTRDNLPSLWPGWPGHGTGRAYGRWVGSVGMSVTCWRNSGMFAREQATRAVAKEGTLQVATKRGCAERPATRATKPWPRHGGRGTRAKQQRPAPGTDAGSAGSEDNSGGRSAGHGSRSKWRSGGPERKRRPTVTRDNLPTLWPGWPGHGTGRGNRLVASAMAALGPGRSRSSRRRCVVERLGSWVQVD
jgi:hypothetical protein